MATLADELLADLMEEDSDADEHEDEEAPQAVGLEDSDAEDNDEDMDDADIIDAAARKTAATEADGKEEIKAISDVRSVAGLIKSLKPVLDVS